MPSYSTIILKLRIVVPRIFSVDEFIRFIKKNKGEVLYFFLPNNLLDKYFHFFLPVFLKHASIAQILKYF